MARRRKLGWRLLTLYVCARALRSGAEAGFLKAVGGVR